MWLTKIDKDKIINSRVDLTLWELENIVEDLGGLFELTDSGVLVITFPKTNKTFIYSIFCHECKHERIASSISICDVCKNASEFEKKDDSNEQ